MKENKLFDERQVAIRGSIYKHCLMVMGMLLLLHMVLQLSGLPLMDSVDADLFMVMFTTMVGSIEMIVKEVYWSEKQRVSLPWIISILALLAALSLVMTVYEMAARKIGFISNGVITHDGATLIFGGCILLICAVFAFKIVIKISRSGEE